MHEQNCGDKGQWLLEQLRAHLCELLLDV